MPLVRENDWEPWTKEDTPASFISRAFQNYEHRLALGIPSSSVLFDPARPDLTFGPCRLVEAAGLTFTLNRDYWWITYGQLGVLATKTARIIRSLVPRGSFIGISGFNGIEWAVCDLACALAGCVSVGLHTTFDTASALHAIQHTDISLLLCVSDVVLDSATTADSAEEDSVVPEHDAILTRGSATAQSMTDFWTVQKVLALHRSHSVDRLVGGDGNASALPLQHIVLLDQSMHSFEEARGQGTSAAKLQGLPLHSLLDLMTVADTNNEILDVVLEPAESQPDGGRAAISTILFTSGSVGRPKGVVVSAGTFFNDICSRNYVEPLVTVSYIPLSHSSDRLKMWEFLGNGGRVGFAHYSPSNWLDHEQTKKVESVQSSGTGSNDVEGLFRQVQRLEPTAMACPPNIWNGLYYLYQQWARTDGADKVREAIAAMFGPRIKFLVTGGGPTAAEVVSFAKDLFPQATFADSYGTTECGAITSNGKAIRTKRVRLRLGPVDGVLSADCGEMWVSSPNMSSGYYKDPERTSECFVQDGTDSLGQPIIWYKTGDLVRVTDIQQKFVLDGQDFWDPSVTVMGRLASAVRLAGGAVVSPDVLEATYAVSPLLSQIYIHGRSDSTALVAVVVRTTVLMETARLRHLSKSSPSSSPCCSDDPLAAKLMQSLHIHGAMHDADQSSYDETVRQVLIEELCKVARENNLREADIPGALQVEDEPWTVDNGMLNASFKKQRAKFAERYETVVTCLHSSLLA